MEHLFVSVPWAENINLYKMRAIIYFMKGVFIILDGMGDLPNSQLKGKTPLEAANTPNLDFFAARGEMGLMNSVKPGFTPGSDEAIVCIFGNDLIDSTRGQLEAQGSGMKLVRGDLAFRVNFGTIDEKKKGEIVDRRAGRTLTNDEAEELANAINVQVDLPNKFFLKPSVQHRASLVFRGGLSDNITGNDLTYSGGKIKAFNRAVKCMPLDDTELSQYTANLVNEFLRRSFEVLNNHPINEERRRKGLLPANYLFLRGAGVEIPKLKQYKKWASVAYMPLETGFSELCGMKVFGFEYPKLTNLDSYDNLYRGLRKACKFAVKTIKRQRKNFDYFYIHIKETDLPGHDNKPLMKKDMLEYIDRTLIKFLRKFAPPNQLKVAVTADHSTPCALKNHSADPVPVLLYDGTKPNIPRQRKFSEKDARQGTLGKFNGQDLMKIIGFGK